MTTSDKRPRRTTKTVKTAKTSDHANTSGTPKAAEPAKTTGDARTLGGANTPGMAAENGADSAGRAAYSTGAAGRAQAAETRPIKAISISVTSRHREDRHASIALAAYFRSELRGFAPGHEIEDWLEAEEEVDQRLLGEGRAS